MRQVDEENLQVRCIDTRHGIWRKQSIHSHSNAGMPTAKSELQSKARPRPGGRSEPGNCRRRPSGWHLDRSSRSPPEIAGGARHSLPRRPDWWAIVWPHATFRRAERATPCVGEGVDLRRSPTLRNAGGLSLSSTASCRRGLRRSAGRCRRSAPFAPACACTPRTSAPPAGASSDSSDCALHTRIR